MAAIIREEPEPLPATVPAPLRWTIARCLAKDPGDRYGSTRDLYLELRIMRDRLFDSLTTLTASAAVSPVRRRVLWAATAFVLGLLACSAVFIYLHRTPVRPDALRYTPFATSGCRERSPAWSFDGRTLAYVCDVDGVAQLFPRATDSPSAAQVTNEKQPALAPFWSADGPRSTFRKA